VKAGTYFPGNGCPDGLHYGRQGQFVVAGRPASAASSRSTPRHHPRLCADPEWRPWRRPLRFLAARQTQTIYSRGAVSGPSGASSALSRPHRTGRRAPAGAAVTGAAGDAHQAPAAPCHDGPDDLGPADEPTQMGGRSARDIRMDLGDALHAIKEASGLGGADRVTIIGGR